MDPRDFLAVAERLRASSVEADCRTSIGRSYYAVFKTLADWLTHLPLAVPTTGEAHEAVIYYFMKCPDSDAKQIGAILQNLRATRTQADYQMTLVLRAGESEFAFRKAAHSLVLFDQREIMLRGLMRSVPAYKPTRP
jgi:hypothetical protein